MKAWLLCALFSTQVLGEVPEVEIKNFNFDYKAPLGEGVAEYFSYGKKVNQVQNVKVERVGDDFEVLLEGVEDQYLTFKGAPDFMTSADYMKLNSLFLKVSDSISFSLASGYFQSPFRILELKNFKFQCEQTIKCIESMSIQASSIHSNGEGLTEMFIKAFDERESGSTPIVDVKDLELRINNGRFTLSGYVKAQLSGKVRSKGEIKYEAPLRKVTLRIEEVKFGILNVTSKVLEELKKHESEKMKVIYPHIYLQLQ